MEIHSVLPEERAKDANGEYLPWGYRYLDPSRNPRQPPEESGPFGRNRSLRYTGSRTPRASRTGTTPVRQKEDATIAEFSKLFSREKQKEEQEAARLYQAVSPPTIADPPRLPSPEAIATECLLYGYASKSAEWKVVSKYERIVSPSIICEDFPREDPMLFQSSTTPTSFSRNSVVVHKNLSKDARRKSSQIRSGKHWLKVTFDSLQAAERACHFSPVEIDGHLVFCEVWTGKGPFSDAPLLKGSQSANEVQRMSNGKLRTLTTSQSTSFLSGTDSTIAGFERAMHTLPRSHAPPDIQYGRPTAQDDTSIASSTTASSATATNPFPAATTSTLRSQSVPTLPTQTTPLRSSEYMTHIPSIRKTTLRPASEALPPQPSQLERILRTVPVVSYFLGTATSNIITTNTTTTSKPNADLIGEGPLLKDDGSWDDEKNGWYWSFWHNVDRAVGSDFCGVKEE